MDFTVEKRGNSNFLSYVVNEGELDDFAIKMFSSNNIPFMIPFSIVHRDDETVIEYDIASLRTMDVELSGVFTIQRLNGMLSSFINAYTEIENFMLDADHVIFEPDYVFFDRTSDSVKLIYMPVKGLDYSKENPLERLAEILEEISFDSEDSKMDKIITLAVEDIRNGTISDVEGLKTIQKQLNSSGVVGGVGTVHRKKSEIRADYMQRMSPEADNAVRNNVSGNNFANSDRPAKAEPEFSANEQKNKSGFMDGLFGGKKEAKSNSAHSQSVPPISGSSNPKSSSMAIPGGPSGMAIPGGPSGMAIPGGQNGDSYVQEETPIKNPPPVKEKKPLFGGFGAKKNQERNVPVKPQVQDRPVSPVVKQQPAKAGLVSESGEVTIIDTELFKIGRSGKANLSIQDDSVSWEHAEIRKHGVVYKIVDTNSSNHTYINGDEMKPDKVYTIKDGDQINFYTHAYKFKFIRE